jgi:hypothetical protein
MGVRLRPQYRHGAGIGNERHWAGREDAIGELLLCSEFFVARPPDLDCVVRTAEFAAQSRCEPSIAFEDPFSFSHSMPNARPVIDANFKSRAIF